MTHKRKAGVTHKPKTQAERAKDYRKAKGVAAKKANAVRMRAKRAKGK